MLLILVFGVQGCTVGFSPAPSHISDEERIKETIHTYFTLRYQALQANVPLVLDAIVDLTDPKALEWLKLEADRRAVEMAIHSEFPMTIVAYKYDLNFTGIEITQNTAVVQLLEGNQITYANNPESPSWLAGLEHEISLVKGYDQWLLTNDVYSDDIIRLLKISTKEKLIDTIKFNAAHTK